MDYIKDNTIIICEENTKISLLKKLTNSFLNIKFYTKKEFFNEYFFKYDENTLYYLIKKYNYKIDVAKMYLDNLIYIDTNKKYKSNKLNYLVKLKEELNNNNLLIYNDNFLKNIKDYQLVVLNYPYLDNYEIDIFNKLNAKIINNKLNNNLEKVYVFDNIEEEINYVAKSICKLINNGVDINKIKIMGIDNSYYNDLYRIFKLYNLIVKIPSNNYLISNNIAKIYLNEGIESIKNKDKEIVNRIISINNKYVNIDDNDIKKELIIDELKNRKINNFNYKYYIDVVNINDIILDDDYVFFMNFNNNNIPSIIKDDSYITDNIKYEVNLITTYEINKQIKEYEIKKLKSINNLIITSKLNDKDGECFLSSLVNELNMEIKHENDNILDSYSKKYDLIKLCKCLDNYNKYGIISDEYIIYKNNLNINYNTYNNEYTKVDKNDLKEYLHNKLTLSYSSINNYSKCKFRYYLANILKIDKYEDTSEAFIGSVFHDVLEKSFKDDIDVIKCITDYITNNKIELTLKERFYLNKIIKDIMFVIKVLKIQNNYIGFDKSLYEQNIIIDKSKDISINFIGFIDKILYKEEDNSNYIAIIDYKTGNTDTSLSYLKYGLNLQLPIYLYLVKNSKIFNNPIFTGFYIQNILDKDIKRDLNKNFYEQYSDNLKLVGYSNSSIHNISLFDSTYENSKLIKNLKIKKDGNFYSSSKVLDNEEINIIINTVQDVIDDSINHILDADFKINPKKIGYDDDIGCKYCKFKDICFKKEKDYVIIKKEGEENA